MQYDEEKRDRLNRLEKKLYSRNAPKIIQPEKKPDDFYGSYEANNFASGNEGLETPEIKENWQETKNSGFDELASKVSQMAQRKNNFVRRVFVFSLVFFVLALGVATFVFMGGVNSVSSKNVDIKVSGPVSIGGGQEVSYEIDIVNGNNIDLESVSLLVEYPTGTRSASDLTKELANERFSLDTIGSGQDFKQNIKAVFFGEKESVKELKISLEYRVKNSSALFYKDKVFEFSISSAPIIVTPTYPKEINSNQDVSFDIELASNSQDKVQNFLVSVDYPFGFTFKDASPKATFGNNVWQFQGLDPGDKKRISIKGSIIGQDNEEKVFKINAGTPSSDDERMIAVPFSNLTESILIKKPFIGASFSIEGEGEDYAAQGGNYVNNEITIANNLPTKLFNVSVEVSLSGGALDQSGVSVSNNGFFQSTNNTILWDKRSVSDFSEMEPGSQKSLSFRMLPLSFSKVSAGAKPEINMVAKIRGERISDSGSVESISAVAIGKIVLVTSADISARTVRSIGNLENSGPIPPRAGNPTTYTVYWSISNSFNQISNVVVKATLPSYVKWTNIKSPSSEIFTYNKDTNEVVWNVGSILPSTGFSSTKKEIYFQLEFLPSVSQIGQTPIILGETSLSGTDKITGLKISARANAITTNFSGDPTFKSGDEKVAE